MPTRPQHQRSAAKRSTAKRSTSRSRKAPQAPATVTPIEGNLLDVAGVAAILGVAPRTIYRWVEAGELPHRKVGGRLVRFTRADVDAFINASASEASR